MEKPLLEQLDGKAISGWNGMEIFGVKALTSEACAFGMRVLCDASESGLSLLRDYLGVPALLLSPPMNAYVGESDAVGSIMLQSQGWRSLARFAAFRAGALAVREEALDSIIIALPQTLKAYEEAKLTL